tara:strand:- start:341 stop:1384 length:1044 start_codon:yes stop_codon:yes gene_type:complete
MPKTATTTLQSQLFVNENVFFPIGRFGIGGESTASEIIGDLLWEGIFLDELNYKKREPEYKLELNRLISIAQEKNLCPVISQESFGFPSRFGSDYDILFSRIKDLIGDCRVLFLIREQGSWLRSYYSTFVADMGGTLSFKDYIFINENIPNHRYNFVRSLDYEHIISVLERHFSEIIVRPYEEILKDFPNQIKQLMSLFEIDIPPLKVNKSNVTPDKKTIELARNMNKILPRGFSASLENFNLSINSPLFKSIKQRKEKNISLQKNEMEIYNEVMIERNRHLIQLNDKAAMYELANILNLWTINESPMNIDIDFLKSNFSESNQNIAKKFNLPLQKYNYVGFQKPLH